MARYYTVRAGDRVNTNAAWYYPHPSPLARKIKNHVAFWNGIQVDLEAGTRPPARTPGAPAASGPSAASGPEMPPGAAG